MADDAAGAVRRTQRPAPAPELIYGTARTDPIGTVREHDDGTTAVKVSMGDDSTKGQHVWCWMNCKLEVRWLHHYDVAEWAVLAAPEERPIVLLRADDCDCGPPYADCPHGPEPVDALDLAVWLHAEARHQHAELLAQRDGWWNHVNDERNALLPRLAELAEQAGKLRTAEWVRTCALLPMEEWPPAPAYKGPMVPAAELDALQAHIDAALAVLDLPWPDDEDHHDFVNGQVEAARATLRAAQPTGEADRG